MIKGDDGEQEQQRYLLLSLSKRSPGVKWLKLSSMDTTSVLSFDGLEARTKIKYIVQPIAGDNWNKIFSSKLDAIFCRRMSSQ